jgi:hypothetical protein
MPVLSALIKKVTITALNDSKTYDGAAYFGNRGASYAGDDFTYLTGTLVYGGLSQGAVNAGTYAITASGVTSTNPQYSVAYVNGNLTIAKAPLTLSAAADTKVYDGNTSSTGTVNISGLKGTDTLTGLTQSFDSKNVLGGDASSLKLNTGYIIQDGNSGANYTVVSHDAVGSISRLQTVAWVGGTSGSWFDPINWAGGAVPDLANVANVTIPSGVNVSFNNSLALPAQAGAVHVDNIASSGALSMLAGTLSVATLLTSDVLNQSGGVVNGTGSINVNSLNQTGGAILSAGNLRVNQSFVQSTDGVIAVGGDVTISQAMGDLEINHLSGQAIDLSAAKGAIQLGEVNALGTLSILAQSDITQKASGNLSAASGSTITSKIGDINLPNLSNNLDGLTALKGRNITLSDDSGPTIVLDASGDSTLNSGGNLVVSGATNNLSTSTYNGGSTSYGATTVSGNLATNSAGTVSQTNTVTVVGTATITTAAQDLTSILADKALADAAAAKAIADAAIAKALADAATAAEAKAIADAAAAKAIADAAIAKALADAATAAEAKAIADAAAAKLIADVAVANMTSEVRSDKVLANVMLLRLKMSQAVESNDDTEAAQKIIKAARDAKLVAEATAAQVVIEAGQTKFNADVAAFKRIDDAQKAKVLAHAANIQLMEDTSASIWGSRDVSKQRAIADKAAALNVIKTRSAERVIGDAERVTKLIAQIAANQALATAAIAKVSADAVATKVIADASDLASSTNGATWKVIMAAKEAKSTMDIANAQIIANARDSKRIMDEAGRKEEADAVAAAKVVVVAAADARSLSQALMSYLIERIASLH